MRQGLPTEAETRELRSFGLTMAAVIPALFGLLLPWLWGREYRLWPWLVAAVFAGAALLMPVGLRTTHRLWTAIGHGLGWVNSRILLGVIYCAVVVPAGVVLRLAGRDPMHRRMDKAAPTYRSPSAGRGKEEMERPF